MRDESPTDVEAVLALLAQHGVEYVIVGMVSAVLQGAPVTTFDLDLVYRRDPENIGRVMHALEALDAYVRVQHGRRLRVDESHLATTGAKLLRTRFGRVDFPGAVGDGESYEQLLAHSDVFELGSFRVRALTLEKYIELKERAGRPRDIAVLPLLRAALREQRRSR